MAFRPAIRSQSRRPGIGVASRMQPIAQTMNRQRAQTDRGRLGQPTAGPAPIAQPMPPVSMPAPIAQPQPPQLAMPMPTIPPTSPYGGMTPGDALGGGMTMQQPQAPTVANPLSQIPVGPEYNTIAGPMPMMPVLDQAYNYYMDQNRANGAYDAGSAARQQLKDAWRGMTQEQQMSYYQPGGQYSGTGMALSGGMNPTSLYNQYAGAMSPGLGALSQVSPAQPQTPSIFTATQPTVGTQAV